MARADEQVEDYFDVKFLCELLTVANDYKFEAFIKSSIELNRNGGSD